MRLTKEQAIEGHRKMWNWIADRLAKATPRDDFNVYDLKKIIRNPISFS